MKKKKRKKKKKGKIPLETYPYKLNPLLSQEYFLLQISEHSYYLFAVNSDTRTHCYRTAHHIHYFSKNQRSCCSCKLPPSLQKNHLVDNEIDRQTEKQSDQYPDGQEDRHM